MDITTDTATTDLVVLDADVTALTDSDNEGSSNAAFGAICLAAGVAIGTFVVPPVVGYVKSWFTSAEPDIAAKVEEIMAPVPEKPAKKVV